MTHQRESLLMYSSEASSSGVAGEVTSTYTRRQFSLMPDAAAALCQSVTSCCCWRLPLLSTLLLLPVPPSVSLSPAAAAAGVAGGGTGGRAAEQRRRRRGVAPGRTVWEVVAVLDLEGDRQFAVGVGGVAGLGLERPGPAVVQPRESA